MYEQLLTRYHWLQLSNEQRIAMRREFGITKSGGVEMVGNKIISDGCNENDLKVVNIASMQSFLGSADQDDTFETLFNATVKKIDALRETYQENDAVEVVGPINYEQRFITMFYELDDDTKERVLTVLNAINKKVEVTEEIPNANIKKAGRPKKVKEGSDIEGTESSGSGN